MACIVPTKACTSCACALLLRRTVLQPSLLLQPTNCQRATLVNQRNNLLNNGMVSETMVWVCLEFACGRRQSLCQFQNASLGLRLGKSDTFSKLIPVPRLDFAELVFAPDLHCHLGRQCGIHRRKVCRRAAPVPEARPANTVMKNF